MTNPMITRLSRLSVASLLALTLAACAVAPAQPLAVQPQAMALSFPVTPDAGLAPDTLKQVNKLLQRQGRLNRQTLHITPLTPQGVSMAQRLGQVLQEAGAAHVQVNELADVSQQEQAMAQGWDIELRSEALALDLSDCAPLKPELNRYPWTSSPYWGMGPLGCANRQNLARMVSDPRDLIQPKALEATDGTVAAEAVRRYHEDEVKELGDIDFAD